MRLFRLLTGTNASPIEENEEEISITTTSPPPPRLAEPPKPTLEDYLDREYYVVELKAGEDKWTWTYCHLNDTPEIDRTRALALADDISSCDDGWWIEYGGHFRIRTQHISAVRIIRHRVTRHTLTTLSQEQLPKGFTQEDAKKFYDERILGGL